MQQLTRNTAAATTAATLDLVHTARGRAFPTADVHGGDSLGYDGGQWLGTVAMVMFVVMVVVMFVVMVMIVVMIVVVILRGASFAFVAVVFLAFGRDVFVLCMRRQAGGVFAGLGMAVLVVRGVVHLDGRVCDAHVATHNVCLSQGLAGICRTHVCREGGGVRGERPNVQVVDVVDAWDGFQTTQNFSPIHLHMIHKRKTNKQKVGEYYGFK